MKKLHAILAFILIIHSGSFGQNEVFLHTDKDFYQAGDSLSFKAYVISNNPSGTCPGLWLSVYLIDADGNSWYEGLLDVENCQLIHSFELPGSLSEGNYTLVANCTANSVDLAWSKKIMIREMQIPRILIDLSPIFERFQTGAPVKHELGLSNPDGSPAGRTAFKFLVKVNGTQVIEGKGKTDKAGKGTVQFNFPPFEESDLVSLEIEVEELGNSYRNGIILPTVAKPILLSFYPEGGLFVDGFESKVGFTAFTLGGTPLNLKAQLVDPDGNSLGSVQSIQRGLGSFLVKADISRPLKFRIIEPDWCQMDFDLPKVNTNGVVLHLQKMDEKLIELEAVNPIPDTYMSLRLQVNQHGREIQSSKILLNTNKTISIPASGLSRGILRVNLLNSKSEVMAQRCLFIEGKEYDKPADSKASLSVTNAFLSPQWEVETNSDALKHLGTEVAQEPFGKDLSRLQGEALKNSLEALMLSSIQSPDRDLSALVPDSLKRAYFQEKYKRGPIEQYLAEINMLQFINKYFLSAGMDFVEFYQANYKLLEDMQLLPAKLSPEERVKRQLENGKSVLSIIMGIRAYRLVDNQMVFRGSDSFNHQGGAVIIIDGVNKGANISELRNLNPYEVASIKVSTNISEIIKYAGMEDTAGVVIIETRKAEGTSIDPVTAKSNRYNPCEIWNPNFIGTDSDIPATSDSPGFLKTRYWKKIIGL